MLNKSTIAVGAIAIAAMAFQAAPAQADGGITFSFGSNGDVGVTIGSDRSRSTGSGKLSCGRVESILYYDHGFRNIHAVDCSGSNYWYNALHHGDPVRVGADAWSGNVTQVRRR